MRAKSKFFIGIDLGGTKINIGLVDEKGKLHRHLKLATEKNAALVEKQIVDSILDLKKDNEIEGIGIGVAGQIDSKSGEVIFGPNLKWHHVPLRENLQKILNIPVHVVNDVRALTIGEWIYGAGKECNELLCVFIGTGIGGGIVSGGRLLTGCSNTFGEVGHLTINFNGPKCTCGKTGCFEAYAGGWGIAARAQEYVNLNRKECAHLISLCEGKIENITAKLVIKAYREGEIHAKIILDEVKKGLIAGFASLINAYNPCRLVLGGGIIEGMPEWIEDIQKGINEFGLKAATQSLEVVKASLTNDLGVVGAAAAAILAGKK